VNTGTGVPATRLGATPQTPFSKIIYVYRQTGRPASAGRFCVLFVYTAQGIYRKRRKNGVSGIIFEYFLKIRRKRLNICADLCYTYNVVYSASEEYILADSGNNIVNNTP
jgi:hypothetical protein